MCFGKKEENLSLLRWEEGMANMVLINIKLSPSLLPPCPQTHKIKSLLCSALSISLARTSFSVSLALSLSLSIKGHEMRNFSKVSLQKRGLASSPVYRCGREPSKRDSLSTAQESGNSHSPEARLSGTYRLKHYQ